MKLACLTMSVTLLPLLVLPRAAGAADANAPIRVENYEHTIRVACVGDSITAGVGASRGQAYPDQLGKMLGRKWEVRNFGVSGCTLLNHGDNPYQKQGAFKAALAYKPDVVVIMLGTNDTKPQNWKFNDQLAADYKELVGRFAMLPSKPRIYLCRPDPVPGGGNWGINEPGVKEEIPIIDKVAAETASGVIDMHAALADHAEMFPDHVHPNNAGATAMARAACKALTGKDAPAAAPLSPQNGRQGRANQ